ncbi:MAG: KH domain-containing protein [Patescibacteria group bacterium]
MTDSLENTVDTQILHDILANLVTEPDNIKVGRELDEQGVLLTVIVDAKDMGIVIGRNGSMATAIRTVMRAVGKANKMNLRLHFLEPDGSVRYGDKEVHGNTTNSASVKSDYPQSATATSSQTIEEDLSDFVIN